MRYDNPIFNPVIRVHCSKYHSWQGGLEILLVLSSIRRDSHHDILHRLYMICLGAAHLPQNRYIPNLHASSTIISLLSVNHSKLVIHHQFSKKKSQPFLFAKITHSWYHSQLTIGCGSPQTVAGTPGVNHRFPYEIVGINGYI